MTSAVDEKGAAAGLQDPLRAPFDDARVLLVTDDAGLTASVRVVLGDHGYAVEIATHASAVERLGTQAFDLLLLDAGCNARNAVSVLDQLRAVAPATGAVLICEAEALDSMGDALAHGALDFIVRPVEALAHRTLASVNQGLRACRLARENRRLNQRLAGQQCTEGLVGCSPQHRRLLGVLARASESDVTILIEGQAGSGKTTVAERVHRGSRRASGPLVARSCDALAADAIDRAVAEANGGTLLLENVDRLPTDAQARLVRYLKERPEGRTEQPRVIATTTARLPELVARGAFREDLYYRLNVLPVRVPSLAERPDDVPVLAMHFLHVAAAAAGGSHNGFTPAAMALLESNGWPGNAAQLASAVARGHAVCGAGTAIEPAHLLGGEAVPRRADSAPAAPRRAQPATAGYDDDEEVLEEDIVPFKDEEKRILSRALRATKGNVRRAAQLLRIGRATLYRKIQSYKLRLH